MRKTMVISLLLTLVFFCPLIAFDVPLASASTSAPQTLRGTLIRTFCIFDKPIVTIAVFSDPHIGGTVSSSDGQISWSGQAAFANTLADTEVAGADTVAIVGDMTNDGEDEQYSTLKDMYVSGGRSLDTLFPVAGNHEQRAEAALMPTYWERFRTQFGFSTSYHDTYVRNVHLIGLACDVVSDTATPWASAEISQTQLDWLEGQLASDWKAGRVSLVFCHWPIMNTVCGSYPDEYGYEHGLVNSEALRTILDRYPNAIYFSGHTHVDLRTSGSIYRGTGKSGNAAGALYVHDGAIFFLRGSDGKHLDSEGYIVEVYGDRIELHSRDFTTHGWIAEHTVAR